MFATETDQPSQCRRETRRAPGDQNVPYSVCILEADELLEFGFIEIGNGPIAHSRTRPMRFSRIRPSFRGFYSRICRRRI